MKKLLVFPFALLMLSLTACGATVTIKSKDDAAAPTPTSTNAKTDLADAEATVNAFFQVKSKASDSLNDKIDGQMAYLTNRDVHPTVAYTKPGDDTPVGVEEKEVKVSLSDAKLTGDTISINFKSKTNSITYPTIGDTLAMDQGSPAYSTWDGVATLKKVNKKWLIDSLSMDHIGGGVEAPLELANE